MNIKRNTKQHILALLAIGGLVVLPYQTIAQTPPVSPADNSFNRTADPNQAGTGCVNNPTACAEINAQIAENQQKLDTLNQQKSQYQQQIDQARWRNTNR